ncbi:MAG TPA: hypothetical protein VD931_14165 [Baekduia sp.]|nr:hypothetical protein [Baekduia sp.]
MGDYERAAMVLEDVSAGRRKATRVPDPEAGGTRFDVDGGYTVVVFFDCGHWDYIDVVQGNGLDLDPVVDGHALANYRPRTDAECARWGCRMTWGGSLIDALDPTVPRESALFELWNGLLRRLVG